MKNVFEKVEKFVKEHPVITGVAVTGIVSGITGVICYELGKNDISNIDVVLDHVPHPTTGVPVPEYANMCDLSENTDFCKEIDVRHFYDPDFMTSVTIGTRSNVDKYFSWWKENVEPHEQEIWDAEWLKRDKS